MKPWIKRILVDMAATVLAFIVIGVICILIIQMVCESLGKSCW